MEKGLGIHVPEADSSIRVHQNQSLINALCQPLIFIDHMIDRHFYCLVFLGFSLFLHRLCNTLLPDENADDPGIEQDRFH